MKLEGKPVQRAQEINDQSARVKTWMVAYRQSPKFFTGEARRCLALILLTTEAHGDSGNGR
jgi:hypothetical protein